MTDPLAGAKRQILAGWCSLASWRDHVQGNQPAVMRARVGAFYSLNERRDPPAGPLLSPWTSPGR